jgi:hypothetical protein
MSEMRKESLERESEREIEHNLNANTPENRLIYSNGNIKLIRNRLTGKQIQYLKEYEKRYIKRNELLLALTCFEQ